LLVKVLNFLKKPAFIASLAVVLILTFALIILSIGMADNGDFFRVLTANDLYSFEQDGGIQHFGYFDNEYGIRQYYNDATAGGITTSQNLFIKAAVAIDTFFTHDYVFDVRYLAGLQILCLALGVFLFVDYLTFNKKAVAGYLIAALVVLVFADLAYGAYFNSFYQEATVYISFMICISSALLLGQRRKYNPYFLLVLFALSALLLIFAKQQNAPLGVVLAVLCIFIAFRTQLKRFRTTALIIAGALAVSGIAVYVLIPQKFVDINKYQTMTRGTMLSAEDPEEALKQFLINRQYALLNGTTTFDRYPEIKYDDETMTTNFYDKFSYLDVAMFYLKNPDQLYTMMDYASRNLYLTRPEMIGNYEMEAGMEYGAKTGFFVFYSTLKQNITPKTIGFLIMWCLGAILLGLRNRYQMLVIILCILIGLSQIIVSIVGDGDADFAKHVFLYTLMFDYINVIGMSWLIGFAFRGKKKDAVQAEQTEAGYYTEYPEERRIRYGNRRTKRRYRRKTTAFICLVMTGVLMTAGCSAGDQSGKTQAAEKSGAPANKSGQNVGEDQESFPAVQSEEEKTFRFVQQKLMENGGIRTNYLDQDFKAGYATGGEVLSESQGLYMLYAAQKKDEAAFGQAFSFTQDKLDNGFLFSYRYDPSGKHQYNMNAALDDLRIINALLAAGESFNNAEYTGRAGALAGRFYNTNVKDGFLYGVYDSDYKTTNDSVTLCYIDLQTLNQLAELNGSYRQVAQNMDPILKNGFISKEFPMFYNEYSYKDAGYDSGQDVNMVQSMLSALHLAQAGECPAETVQYIKGLVSAGKLYGAYSVSGQPHGSVESTALYAIAALIGKAVSDDELYQKSIGQMKRFMVTDQNSGVYGGFADAATNSAYSFDNLMALLAFRAGDPS
jgi:hypothetical protein